MRIRLDVSSRGDRSDRGERGGRPSGGRDGLPRPDSASGGEKNLSDVATRLEEPLRILAAHLERGNFAEYVSLITRPSRLLWINFLGGLSRGVGIGVGFTVIGAFLVYVLQALAVYNLPVIGGFIADLVRIVRAQLNTPRIP